MRLLRSGHVLIAVLFGLGGVLAACGGESSGIYSDGNERSAASAGSASGDGSPMAPAFSVSTGAKSAFSLDEHGGEVVLLYFSFPG